MTFKMGDKMQKKRIEVSKRIDNLGAYIIYNVFSNIWEVHAHGAELSSNTVRKYHAFIESLYNDIGFLQCDTIENEYLVECGYNFAE